MMFQVQWHYVTAAGVTEVEAETPAECRRAVAVKLNPEGADALAGDPSFHVYVVGAMDLYPVKVGEAV